LRRAEPRPGGVGGTLREDMRRNKLIDTKISKPLFNLPLATIASGDPPTALPQRNLLRHVTWLLPSGQSIARGLAVPALSKDDLRELRQFGKNLDESTPLWYYVRPQGGARHGEWPDPRARRRTNRGRGLHRAPAARP
jgi:hypothetical protein